MLSWIEIDAAALRQNYRLFCGLAGKERVAPVLKSNAYGHGLEVVYKALEPEGPSWICVNYVEEAKALRRLGYAGRLLVVGPSVPEELARAAEDDIEITVGNEDVLAAWQKLAHKAKLHVKFDTGMGRQGFAPEQAEAIAERLAPMREHVVGISTHFANVEDVTDYTYPRQQLEAFHKAVAPFRARGFKLSAHAASSASCLLLEESRFDLERVGIALYGLWPSQATRISYMQTYGKLLELKPALTWRTRITTIKPVKAGQFVGYGCTYRAHRDMTVGVLPVGYYEGYPRLAGDHSSYVLLRGQRCPIIGRICMNMMMIDVTHIPDLRLGEQVTLIGADGKEVLHASDVAAWAQTIHYELVTRLHGEIPRTLVLSQGGEVG